MMRCPNCEFNNFDTSAFCSQCGKPLHYLKNNHNGENDASPKTKGTQSASRPKRSSSKSRATASKTKTSKTPAKTKTKPVSASSKPKSSQARSKAKSSTSAAKTKPAAAKRKAQAPSVAKSTKPASKPTKTAPQKPKRVVVPVPLEDLPDEFGDSPRQPTEGPTPQPASLQKPALLTPPEAMPAPGEPEQDKRPPLRLKTEQEGAPKPQGKTDESPAKSSTLPGILPQEGPGLEHAVPNAVIQPPPAPEVMPRVVPRDPKPPASAPIVHVVPKRRVSPLLVISIVAVLGIIATLMVVKPGSGRKVPPISVPMGPPHVAVLPFAFDSGDALSAGWAAALSQALTADLSQADSFSVQTGDQLFMVLERLRVTEPDNRDFPLKDLQDIFRSCGAFYFVRGRITHESGNPAAELALLEAANGDILWETSVNLNDAGQRLSQVDELTARIRDALPLSVEARVQDQDRAFPEYSTINEEAYISYALGIQNQRRGLYRLSLENFEQAVERDPEFSPAYLAAARSYEALGYHYRSWKTCQTAQSMVDRLSENERLHLQGEFYRRSEKTYDIALKVYTRLLELEPDSPAAHNHLGLLYTQLGQWDKALIHFEVNRRNNLVDPDLVLNISRAYALQQDFDQAYDILDDFVQNHFDSADIRLQMAWLHLLQGDPDQALNEVNHGLKLASTHDLRRTKGEILMIKGDLRAAEAEFNGLVTENNEVVARIWGYKRLADLNQLEGRFAKALEYLVQAVRLAGDQQELAWKYRLHLETARIYLELNNASRAMQQCDAAWSIAVQGETMDLPRDALHYRGLCYLGMNRLRDAQRTADRLRGLCEKGPSADRMRPYYHLMGKVEMARGNFSLAVDLFQQGVKLLPPQGLPTWHANNHTLMIDALAEAHYAADNPIKALEEFENVRNLSSGRLDFGDLYARIYYKLGKIREEYGLMDIASNVYQKFLSLWENADSNLPEIRDARKRFGGPNGR